MDHHRSGPQVSGWLDNLDCVVTVQLEYLVKLSIYHSILMKFCKYKCIGFIIQLSERNQVPMILDNRGSMAMI